MICTVIILIQESNDTDQVKNNLEELFFTPCLIHLIYQQKQRSNMTETNITQITPKPKEMFSAVFEKYDNASCLSKSKTHFSDVRSREGGVVTKYLVFDEEVSSTIAKELSLGEYIAFLADIEFKNVEFMNIFEVSGGA